VALLTPLLEGAKTIFRLQLLPAVIVGVRLPQVPGVTLNIPISCPVIVIAFATKLVVPVFFKLMGSCVEIFPMIMLPA